MKKITYIIIIFILALFLEGCYKERVELFTIPIIPGTYQYSEVESIDFLGTSITSFEIKFLDIDEKTDELSDYEANLFGDFSYQEIQLFSIEIKIGFDDEIQVCDAIFMGIANPQRPNAYRLIVTIPELNDQTETFEVILDLDRDIENEDELEVINIQIVDSVNSPSLRIDASFNIIKQNTDE